MLPNPKVKPHPTVFQIGELSDKLSFAYAIEQGYRFDLRADGECEVSKPDGTAYYVKNFICNCPDRSTRGGSHHGYCKHEIWVAQLRPCELCKGIMALGEFKTAFGQIVKRFECSSCGNARDFGLVKAERRVHKYGADDSKLCREAIQKQIDTMDNRYIWRLLDARPDLYDTMQKVALEMFQAYLADAVAADKRAKEKGESVTRS